MRERLGKGVVDDLYKKYDCVSLDQMSQLLWESKRWTISVYCKINGIDPVALNNFVKRYDKSPDVVVREWSSHKDIAEFLSEDFPLIFPDL